jgi:hypothetical protein
VAQVGVVSGGGRTAGLSTTLPRIGRSKIRGIDALHATIGEDQRSGAPSLALLAKGGIPRLRTRGPCPADSAYPTLRQEREGWGSRSLVVTEKRKKTEL